VEKYARFFHFIFPLSFFKGWCLGEVLQVGVLEEGGIFEAEAEEAVQGDVGDPDERERGGKGPVEEIAEEQEGEGKGEGVDEVVGGGSEAGVEEVADHEEVGCEEEDGEEEPTVVEMVVGGEGGEEEDGFFDAEEGGGLSEHRRWIPVWD
jgi:hypothetical protein